jgi:arylsulfatase A-like enzyme
VDEDQSGLRTQHPHWAQRLSESGYRTGYFGKWHIERSNELENFGWQVNGCNENAAFRSLGGGIESSDSLLSESCLAQYETLPEGYNVVLHYGVTEVSSDDREFAATTREAQDFLAESMGKDNPWACCVSYAEPNVPLIAGRDAFEKYDFESIQLPINLHDNFSRSPGFYRRQKEILKHLTDDQWRELRAVYYALISELDREFGKLLDQLEKAGELENTLVIVLSDHGRYVGGHGFDHHNFGAFEEIYRIPLIIAGPGVAQGKETEALVSLPDLCPTLIDLAEAEPIKDIDSRSFSSLLSDPLGEEANFASSFAEYHGTRFTLQQRILWDGPWKFVFNGFDYDELYNLQDDPDELNNLAAEPDQRDRIKAMMAKIWSILIKTDDRSLLGTHYSPMRIGVIGPNSAKGK